MSAESRPDCPDGVLEAMEPSTFTPRTKRSTLTPAGGSRSVSGHFSAAGGAAGAAGRPWPPPAPWPGARQGAGHPVHTLQMLAADAALLRRSAAGVPAVGGPDAPPGAAACPAADCPWP